MKHEAIKGIAGMLAVLAMFAGVLACAPFSARAQEPEDAIVVPQPAPHREDAEAKPVSGGDSEADAGVADTAAAGQEDAASEDGPGPSVEAAHDAVRSVPAPEGDSADMAEDDVSQETKAADAESETPGRVKSTDELMMKAEEGSIHDYVRRHLAKRSFQPPRLPSILLFPDDHARIHQALSGFKTPVKPKQVEKLSEPELLVPTDLDPVAEAPAEPEPVIAPVDTSPRELELGGIMFFNDKDWTIWLNNRRVTPKALPERVREIRVTSGYADILWVDTKTDRLYPIRLRPNQRFNLDARVFLPALGKSGSAGQDDMQGIGGPS